MNRPLLVTGYDTVLGKAIADTAQESSFSVAATVEPREKTVERTDGLMIIEWNRKVILSAQNVLLSATNTLGEISELIISYDLSNDASSTLMPIHELTSLALDTEIDRKLKSQIYILKEALRNLAIRSPDSTLGISFLMFGAGYEVLSPLQALTSGAFVRLAQSCFSMYQNEPCVLRGFHTGSDDAHGFGAFVVESIIGGARDGRWYRYSGTPFPELRFPRK